MARVKISRQRAVGAHGGRTRAIDFPSWVTELSTIEVTCSLDAASAYALALLSASAGMHGGYFRMPVIEVGHA